MILLELNRRGYFDLFEQVDHKLIGTIWKNSDNIWVFQISVMRDISVYMRTEVDRILRTIN